MEVNVATTQLCDEPSVAHQLASEMTLVRIAVTALAPETTWKLIIYVHTASRERNRHR